MRKERNRPNNPRPSTSATLKAFAADLLVDSAVRRVERKYGSTNRLPSTGGLWLPYHNVDHTREVHDATQKVGATLVDAGKLSAEDLAVARVAAAFHDEEQERGSVKNEQASAHRATVEMAELNLGFAPDDYEKVGKMIEATITTLDQRGVLSQNASPDNTLEALIADADLSSLGASNQALTALNLFVERETLAGRMPLPRTARSLGSSTLNSPELRSFLHNQVHQLVNHEFYLPETTAWLSKGQQSNARFMETLALAADDGATLGELLGFAYERVEDPQWKLDATGIALPEKIADSQGLEL